MARVLSMEEVEKLPFNTLQWIEFHLRVKNGRIINDCYQQYFLKGHMGRDRKPGYNDWWRVWDSRPTPKERKETKWKCQISCPAPSVETREFNSITIFMERSPGSSAGSAKHS